MSRSSLWRGFEHGLDLGALFVDFKPASVRSPKRIAQYAIISQCLAIALLCVVVTYFIILARTGHVWSGVVMVGVVILATVVQLVNHRRDR
jgi:hypothetical protein